MIWKCEMCTCTNRMRNGKRNRSQYTKEDLQKFVVKKPIIEVNKIKNKTIPHFLSHYFLLYLNQFPPFKLLQFGFPPSRFEKTGRLLQLGSSDRVPWRAASRNSQKFVWNTTPYSAKLSGIASRPGGRLRRASWCPEEASY